MKQTKLGSFIEAMTNITIGYWVAFVSQLIIFYLLGKDFTFGENIIVGLWFTFISLIRSYALRRFFETIGRSYLVKFEAFLRSFRFNFNLGGLYVRNSRFIRDYGGILGFAWRRSCRRIVAGFGQVIGQKV